MKTLLPLSVFLLVTTSAFGQADNEAEGACANKEGAWEMASATYTYPDSTVEVGPSDSQKLKLLTHSHWIVIYKSPETTGAVGGSHTTEGGKHVEWPEYYTDPVFADVDSVAFDCRIEGDAWYLSGEIPGIGRLEEVWRRVE